LSPTTHHSLPSPLSLHDALPISCTLPVSFKVIHTSSLSGLTAILGQNGLTCGDRLTILCDARSMTASSGVKLEQTKAYLPSGPKDRKSTRLNSSHDQISYAVFCL